GLRSSRITSFKNGHKAYGTIHVNTGTMSKIRKKTCNSKSCGKQDVKLRAISRAFGLSINKALPKYKVNGAVASGASIMTSRLSKNQKKRRVSPWPTW